MGFLILDIFEKMKNVHFEKPPGLYFQKNSSCPKGHILLHNALIYQKNHSKSVTDIYRFIIAGNFSVFLISNLEIKKPLKNHYEKI